MRDRSRVIYWVFALVSGAAHAAVLWVVLEGVSLFEIRRPLSAQTVQLVELPEGVPDPLLPPPGPEPEAEAEAAPPPEPEAPPPPPPEPEAAPEPEAMEEPNRVKIDKTPKSKTTPRPTERPTPRSTPRRATPAPPALARPTAVATARPGREIRFAVGPRQGIPGGSVSAATMSFDNVDFNFAYYATSLRTKIQNNFIAPPSAFTAGRLFEASVYFVVGRNGELLESRIEQSSGFSQFDEAALRAVVVSVPLPPLPVNFRDSEIGIRLKFQCGKR